MPHTPPATQAVLRNFQGSYSYETLDKLVENFKRELSGNQTQSVALHVHPSIECLAAIKASFESESSIYLVPGYYPITTAQELIDGRDASHLVIPQDNTWEWLANSNPVIDSQAPLNRVHIFTSGTTGKPKCAVHTKDSLTQSLNSNPRFNGAVWFMGYPASHFAGFQVLLQGFLSKGTLLMPNEYHAPACIELLINGHPNYFNGTPTLIKQIILADTTNQLTALHSLKLLRLGGELIDQITINLIKKHIPHVTLTHTYGSTETGIAIDVRDEKEGFPLALVDNTKIKIENDMLYLRKNIRSMQQYQGMGTLEQDSWIKTNDIVAVEGDRVLFQGRADDILNLGGYNVSPVQIEKTLLAHPGVEDGIVKGVKNAITGNLIKATLVLNATLPEVKKERIKILKTYCAAHLPDYMVPHMWEFVDKLDVSPVNKKLRR